MKLWHYYLPLVALLNSVAVLGAKTLQTSSLLTCMDSSQFTASTFNVVFFPNNRSLVFDIAAISNINLNITANVQLIAYGITAINTNVSLCSLNYDSICPLTTGHMDLNSNYIVPESVANRIPGIAYNIPDLDARVRVVLFNSTDSAVACVEAVVSNGKTVQTKYAAWPIAAIAGLGVLTSGFISVVGHSATAAHIASNSMSLFIYFQSLVITAMLGVAVVPPVAAAWAQNFVWAMGVIKVNVLQSIANWYVQSTGGTVSDVLKSKYASISVQKKAKRSLDIIEDFGRMYHKAQKSNHLTLFKRAFSLDKQDYGYSDSLDSSLYTTNEKSDLSSKILVLRGIQRVSYLADIEITSLFFTSIAFLFFCAFVLVVCLMFFKAIIEILIKSKVMNEGKFNVYRRHWGDIIKGSLYRILMIAFPQITLMCLWELTTRDSAGTTVIAIFLLIIAVALLFQAAIRVVLLGRESVRNFKNPAYLLYGDGNFLNKFGFIYVQYRADCYYWVAVWLIYVLLKSLFVAVMQRKGQVQALLVMVTEIFYCVAVCYIRPFMDKRTNVFNIFISVINTINALFFTFFSNVFKQPHVVSSVMAVIFFILNAAFALFLLIFTVVTCVMALVYKNPDVRYQPMKDDRVSFIPRFGNETKAQEAQDLELVALGATAMKGHEMGAKREFTDDNDSSAFDPYNTERPSIDNLEPTQPSTLIGNPGNALNDYSAYYGDQRDTPTSESTNPFGSQSSSSVQGNSAFRSEPLPQEKRNVGYL
ncbi:uncharacterized protein KQ657_004914 [Scheffersomyces spartinae]|uniref:ML-like domain-containing protein n=1 Tax=Scheffersomyces spartinae TaxID=45513 RepID=A0A9P8AIB1_9ASCO|nr:uncharacterized protein KQ657_004914 [Scheffersomyces spartinae]KAG7194203.1 hypothetical protein KQ657_004914 [Scheffersomyces spartinae]